MSFKIEVLWVIPTVSVHHVKWTVFKVPYVSSRLYAATFPMQHRKECAWSFVKGLVNG
jgi:hypothetical protein